MVLIEIKSIPITIMGLMDKPVHTEPIFSNRDEGSSAGPCEVIAFDSKRQVYLVLEEGAVWVYRRLGDGKAPGSSAQWLPCQWFHETFVQG